MTIAEYETKYELFVKRATEALEALKASNAPVKGAQIAKWVEEHFPADYDLLKPSWNTHLNTASNEPSTRISRVPGKYTWTLRSAAEAATLPPDDLGSEATQQLSESQSETSDSTRRYTKREAALYPVLRDWLAGRKFRAEDTSSRRKGGKWGNPDVTGLRIIEGLLGAREVELVTIEAKVSNYDWKQVFFEAVSHKRFAHRAYFAFAFGTDEPALERVPEAALLRQYAERFRVGVLVVFMPEAMFESLRSDTEDISLDGSELRVEELWPAVYEPIRPDETVQFLRGTLELETDDAVYAFGRS